MSSPVKGAFKTGTRPAKTPSPVKGTPGAGNLSARQSPALARDLSKEPHLPTTYQQETSEEHTNSTAPVLEGSLCGGPPGIYSSPSVLNLDFSHLGMDATMPSAPVTDSPDEQTVADGQNEAAEKMKFAQQMARMREIRRRRSEKASAEKPEAEAVEATGKQTEEPVESRPSQAQQKNSTKPAAEISPSAAKKTRQKGKIKNSAAKDATGETAPPILETTRVNNFSAPTASSLAKVNTAKGKGASTPAGTFKTTARPKPPVTSTIKRPTTARKAPVVPMLIIEDEEITAEETAPTRPAIARKAPAAPAVEIDLDDTPADVESAASSTSEETVENETASATVSRSPEPYRAVVQTDIEPKIVRKFAQDPNILLSNKRAVRTRTAQSAAQIPSESSPGQHHVTREIGKAESRSAKGQHTIEIAFDISQPPLPIANPLALKKASMATVAPMSAAGATRKVAVEKRKERLAKEAAEKEQNEKTAAERRKREARVEEEAPTKSKRQKLEERIEHMKNNPAMMKGVNGISIVTVQRREAPTHSLKPYVYNPAKKIRVLGEKPKLRHKEDKETLKLIKKNSKMFQEMKRLERQRENEKKKKEETANVTLQQKKNNETGVAPPSSSKPAVTKQNNLSTGLLAKLYSTLKNTNSSSGFANACSKEKDNVMVAEKYLSRDTCFYNPTECTEELRPEHNYGHGKPCQPLPPMRNWHDHSAIFVDGPPKYAKKTEEYTPSAARAARDNRAFLGKEHSTLPEHSKYTGPEKSGNPENEKRSGFCGGVYQNSTTTGKRSRTETGSGSAEKDQPGPSTDSVTTMVNTLNTQARQRELPALRMRKRTPPVVGETSLIRTTPSARSRATRRPLDPKPIANDSSNKLQPLKIPARYSASSSAAGPETGSESAKNIGENQSATRKRKAAEEREHAEGARRKLRRVTADGTSISQPIV